MKLLRTPESIFENLKDFSFDPHYVDIEEGENKIRMHYLEEGPKDGEIILMLHGEPAWCYLYRRMIPGLSEAGFRCIKDTQRPDVSHETKRAGEQAG